MNQERIAVIRAVGPERERIVSRMVEDRNNMLRGAKWGLLIAVVMWGMAAAVIILF